MTTTSSAMPARSRTMLAVTGVAGFAILFAAAVVDDGKIERALLGQSTGQLQWGPSLFRWLLAFHGLVILSATAFGWMRVASGIAGDVTDGAGTERESAPVQSRHYLILVLLCVVALALRAVCLNAGLWHDEIGTLNHYLNLPFGEILTSLPNQNNHILYSLLTRGLMTNFGDAEWVLRLPAALFGVGSIWALFLLGRSVTSVTQTLSACFLMTVSYHHIWFSQNARGYTGVLMFTLLATWLFLEGLCRSQWRWWVGYIFCVSLGMWVHMSMAFVIASHGIVYLARIVELAVSNRARNVGCGVGRWWQPLIAFGLCVTVTLQLYALALPSFVNSGLHEQSLDSEWINPIWVALETARGLMTGFSGARLMLGGAVLLCALSVLCAGWISFLRDNWAFGVIAVLPGILIFAVMYLLRHNLWPRFLFFGAGFALLVVVRGAFELPRWINRVAPRFSVSERLLHGTGYCIVGLIAVASIASLPKYYALPKQDYLGALHFVESNLGPYDVAAAAGLAALAYGGHYAPEWPSIETADELLQLRQRHDCVWVVVSLQIHLEAWHPDIWKLLNEEFELIRKFPGTLHGGDVLIFRDRLSNRTPSGSHSLTAISWRSSCPNHENIAFGQK